MDSFYFPPTSLSWGNEYRPDDLPEWGEVNVRCKEINLSKINASELFQRQFLLRYSQTERVQGSFNHPLSFFLVSGAFVHVHQGRSFVFPPALFFDPKKRRLYLWVLWSWPQVSLFNVQVYEQRTCPEFPDYPGVMTLCFHCLRPGFDSWLGN